MSKDNLKGHREGTQFKDGNLARSKQWTLDAMEIAIEGYFTACNNNVFKVKGEQISEPYTVEGLALCLDLTMQGLWNYENTIGYEPFFETIKKAKLKIQGQKVVNGLIGRSNPAITIFDLKNNHGYKDKQEVEQTNIEIKPLSFEVVKPKE